MPGSRSMPSTRTRSAVPVELTVILRVEDGDPVPTEAELERAFDCVVVAYEEEEV